MFPLIGAALVGAVLMGRTKPKTRVQKKTILGPVSGNTYELEEFAEAGVLVVRAPDGACVTLVRTMSREPGKPAFAARKASGPPPTVTAIIRDFIPLKPKE